MSNSVIDAFKRLNMSTAQDTSDHEAVFEVSYQYLSKVKKFGDINAFHNCIVSLINCDKYYRALQLVDEVPEDIHIEFPVEKAYVYYKTGHFDRLKALYEATADSENCESSSISQRALKHVMAQSYYQNGHVSEALQIYRELISSNSVDNEVDMACNERAILAQLAAKENLAQNPVSSVSAADKTSDTVFNDALIALAGGNIGLSLKFLKEASSLCLDQNMDSDPADLALEIAPIHLTEAYIHQISGNSSQALRVLDSMDLTDVTDLMTRLVFKNNYISLSDAPENVNFSARELNYKDNLHHLRHKLTKPQFQILIKNNLLLSFQSGTLPRDSSYFRSKFYNQYREDFAGDVTPVLYKVLLKLDISMRVLQSTSEAKAISRKLYKFCLKRLELKITDDETVAATLLLVHVSSKQAKYDQAIAILEKVVSIELKGAPEEIHASLVGTLMNIYETRQKSGSKLEQLTQSLTEKFMALTPQSVAESKALYEFVRAFAFKQTASKSVQVMTPLLQLLQQANPNDALVSSALTGDQTGLVPAEELASSKDVEDLLEVSIEELVPNKPVSVNILLGRTQTSTYKVTKKAQKPRFSKNKIVRPESEFDAEKDLDKERWLPLRLRSYYKPSKKDLKKKTGGHQGAVELSPAPVPASTSTSSASKSKSKNKKKKKGKK
ncbi:hypothetical protein METBIDRAFT_36375 [Metschnikowia bicuspidata var. bicuspidata NRRL YB-4993]|uniref:Signal recognition particle subunit SRP72 n=1 Tax=Metschnikowia bicuspidata var. bicuspidata NRRL YB-4993 TaxID=869754 RepID=A0A1A0HJM4_9ASCO|nr:hypothetical protein METBIDRAFT_36375 [Metschnikowia bicuspidata var. bicuspidata NRRL YB-4993]OBA24215.1 hypothetical protein METBIDRAFT_36375 [Metschnikowia bicuspidata var. bicuspidata NRRL YB-4993]